MMTPSSIVDGDSGVLEDDRLDHVRHVLDGVDRRLHGRHDVLPHDHGEGVELTTEQAGLDASVDSVALALQAVEASRYGSMPPIGSNWLIRLHASCAIWTRMSA